MVLDATITHKVLSLGSREGTTGWKKMTYFNSTIEGYRFPRGASFSTLGVGTYAREDAMFITADPVAEGDLLLPSDDTYYEAVTVQEHWLLNSFVFREIQAHELPLWQSAPDSTASWKTGPSDARSRTKTWLDKYVRDASILKDDGSTQAGWATMFYGPPYPLLLEFRGGSAMNGFYAVDQPNSVPMMDMTRSAYGYDEAVPIHIMTVDSEACRGDQLQWRMDAELRYVAQENPLGSQRSLERRSTRKHALGSMSLYDTEYILGYERGIST